MHPLAAHDCKGPVILAHDQNGTVAHQVQATHATALSLFAHARLIHAQGDGPETHSVRSWLEAIGVTVYARAERSLLELSDTTRQAMSTRLRVAPDYKWLDTRLELSQEECCARMSGVRPPAAWEEPSEVLATASSTSFASGTRSRDTSRMQEAILPSVARAEAVAAAVARKAASTVHSVAAAFMGSNPTTSQERRPLRSPSDPVTAVETPCLGAPSPTQPREDSMKKSINALRGADLSKCGWTLVRGVHDLAQTPVGRFALKEGCTDGQVHLDIARELHTPSLKGWCLTTFYVFVVIAILEQAQFCVAQNDLSYYVFPSSSIFYINGVSSDLVQTLREFFLSILILVLLLQKLKSDCRNWPFFPMPLLCSGRVEYVLGWTAYVIFQVLVEAPIISPTKVDRVLSTRWTTNSTEFIQSISPRTVQFHLEYVISILYLTLICMIGLLESVVALINCVTASLRYRDFRYLLSATMRRAEGDRLIA